MSQDSCCKVGRVSAQYGVRGTSPTFDSIDETLLARWKGREGLREHGYRTLTDWFNRRLLKQTYEKHGRRTSDTQLAAEYDILVGDDDLERLELSDELATDGIDADAIRTDMVSWSSMRVHLTNCLGGEKVRKAETDWERNSIEIARSQAVTKISEAVSSLGSKGRVDGGASASVSVDVQLECSQCGSTVPLVVALDRGYICETHDKS
ncbi:rod-determining factor RdfA [Halodesulfurarchaeum sp.]|uniref:rod-determining factor RdfA n=1 Tax=Halodesulfurarchaeum sp. TaxID=1980530 RepID=UPI002FC2F2CB